MPVTVACSMVVVFMPPHFLYRAEQGRAGVAVVERTGTRWRQPAHFFPKNTNTGGGQQPAVITIRLSLPVTCSKTDSENQFETDIERLLCNSGLNSRRVNIRLCSSIPINSSF